jgi:hypothetical protein
MRELDQSSAIAARKIAEHLVNLAVHVLLGQLSSLVLGVLQLILRVQLILFNVNL